MRLAVGALLAIGLIGCSDTTPRVRCSNNAQCTTAKRAGICVPGEDVCAVANASCASGYGYDPTSGRSGCVATTTPDLSTGFDLSAGTLGADMTPPNSAPGADMATADMAQFTGSLTWTAVTNTGTQNTFAAVAGSSPSNVWVVGGTAAGNILHLAFGKVVGTNNLSQAMSALYVNANGAIFAAGQSAILNLTAGAPGTTENSSDVFLGLWGTSDGASLFAVGNAGFYARASTGAWALTVEAPAGSTAPVSAYRTIWGSSPTNIYLAGGYRPSPSLGFRAAIAEDVNGTWNNVTPTGNNVEAMWGTSATDLYFVGDFGSIVHSDGTTLTSQENTNVTTANLYGIYGTSPTNLYAVGASGVILHSTGDGTWAVQNSGTTNTLYAIWAASSTDWYAVGAAGTILHGAP